MFGQDLLIENEFLKIEIKYLKKDIAEFHKLLNKLALKNEELSFGIEVAISTISNYYIVDESRLKEDLEFFRSGMLKMQLFAKYSLI